MASSVTQFGFIQLCDKEQDSMQIVRSSISFYILASKGFAVVE